MSISVIIPCYNENPTVLAETASAVEASLEKVTSEFEVIIVNDGSQKYDYSKISFPHTRIVNHPRNKGYGASLKTGIQHAQYEFIGITDADGTYPNEKFSFLLSEMRKGDWDMIVGARAWKDISLIRRLPKYILTKFASFLACSQIDDLNSGMRIFKKEIALQFWPLYPNGFSFTSTITMGCATNGFNIKYLPIDYFKREGHSYISPIKDTYRFFTLITRLSLYFNPTRFFIPLSMFFFALAIARSIRDYLLLHRLGNGALILFFVVFQVFFFGLIAEIVSKSRSLIMYHRGRK